MSLLGLERLKEQIRPRDIGDRPQILHSEFDPHPRSTEFFSLIIIIIEESSTFMNNNIAEQNFQET